MQNPGGHWYHSMPPRITTVSHDTFAVLFYVVTMRSQEKAMNTKGNGYKTVFWGQYAH